MNRLFAIAVSALAIVVIVLGVLVFVTQQHPPSHQPAVDLTCHNGTVLRLSVEIADSPDERSYGLMNRASMAQDAGMLFVWGTDVQEAFWMENTLIPLDMVFIANDCSIVDIHENATPLSRDLITSSRPYRYVLEVNGGLCAADGVEIGDRVTLDIG